NALTMSGMSFAYDSENHLTSMNGGQVQLIYDGDGNRVAKIANGVTTQYLVDDLNPTGYAQVVEEVVNGAVERQYTYGLQRISEAQSISGTWNQSFYGYDGGGSVRQLTNASAAITDTYNYDAFGNLLNSTGTTPNSYLYRGEQNDSDLGLYYLRARYYNPQTGRFMSRDPEDGKIVDPATQHKYLYAGGDPVNKTDPKGKEAESEYEGIDQDLLEMANKKYQNKAGCVEVHHIIPKYLGGSNEASNLVEIPAAYHQLITNAFRNAYKYGQVQPGEELLIQILQEVYESIPLPLTCELPF
ncbi:MAG: RHS repeat-associated core domain-containing protein, partial [Candidatus Micrarchaeaceae archaeon]